MTAAPVGGPPPPGAPEVRLFDAPDLSALQRNWPRIALRAGVLVLVPLLVTLLARSLDLYGTLGFLTGPLDFLAVGPFAHEAKVVFALTAAPLGLAFLIPRHTRLIVTIVCLVGVLWPGHVLARLNWARLVAPEFRFRVDQTPPIEAWVYAGVLVAVAVVFLLLETLLDTRAQQGERKLAAHQTREAFLLGARTLGALLGLGALAAAVLVAAYLGLRALLVDARLPFRLNPVFVLFGMGVSLAVLVALAARKRSPVEGVPLFVPPRPAPSTAAVSVAPAGAAPTGKPPGMWARMRRAERAAFVLALAGLPVLLLPWSGDGSFEYRRQVPGIATAMGLGFLIASVVTVATYARSEEGRWRRLTPPLVWGLALVPYPLFVLEATSPYNSVAPEFGAFAGFLLQILGLAATLFAARRPAPAA